MKIFFIALVLLPIHIYASNSLDFIQEKNLYDSALTYYKKKDFQNSYKLLFKIYQGRLSDTKFNFYLGRSAYETGNFEVALSAFKRVEVQEPNNLRNKLEMARTYQKLEMYKNAKELFTDVLSNPNIPENVRTNIELKLSSIAKSQQKSFTYATINLDYLYDSNVNYGSLDSEYNVNVGRLPAESEKSDYAFQVYTNITNIYKLSNTNFAIKNKVNLYYKSYRELDRYNVLYYSYTPSLIYKKENHMSELYFGIDRLKLGKINYLKTYFVAPKYEYNHSRKIRSIAELKYQKKSFCQTQQKDLDSNHYSLTYGLLNILSSSSYIQTNLIGIQEKKIQGKRIDVDYKEYKLNIQYANKFTSMYSAEIYAQYRIRNYKDASKLYFNTKRKDSGGKLSTSLFATFFKTYRLHVTGSYSRVHSNHNKYAYQKYIISSGLNMIF